MTVCKFFLQNRCAYGNNCKFEHPQGGAGGAGGSAQGRSGFGQSSFGSTSAFGAPSAGSAFGSSGTFGQSSAFGSSAASGSAFGSTSMPTSAFATQSRPSAFGSQGAPSAFGTPSAFGSASAFGTAPSTSAFGSPSAFGTTSTPSAFGAARPSAFGTPSPQPPPPTTTTTTTTSAFGSSAPASVFGSTSLQPSVAPSLTKGDLATSSLATLNPEAPLTSKTVQYIDSNLPEVTLSADTIAEELGPHGRPLYKLTVYGPARGEPNLVAHKDVSPDELRVMAYVARAAGQEQAYIQHEQKLFTEADQAYHPFASNSNAALQQALRNRAQRNQQRQPAAPPATQFGSTTASPSPAPTASAFGQPSALGGTGAFGQPSAFGNASKPTTSPFGATGSAFGSNTQPPVASAFGATAAAGGASHRSAFGQPSSFGSASMGAAQPPPATFTSSAFGQPPASTSSVFGNTPTNPPGASAFGTSTITSTPSNPTFNANNQPRVQDPYATNAPKSADLTQAVLKAFQADHFEWGALPLVEPPIDVR